MLCRLASPLLRQRFLQPLHGLLERDAWDGSWQESGQWESAASWDQSSRPPAEPLGGEDPGRLRGGGVVVPEVMGQRRGRGGTVAPPESGWVGSLCAGSTLICRGDRCEGPHDAVPKQHSAAPTDCGSWGVKSCFLPRNCFLTVRFCLD